MKKENQSDDKITHSTEEWGQIKAEEREVEKSSVKAVNTLIIHDDSEIRTSRPIISEEIAEVVKWHEEFCSLPQKALKLALDIGFRFRCWKDLVPRGQWDSWLKQNVSQISDRTVRVYLRLDENREWLLNRQQCCRFDSIRAAIALFEEKSKDERRQSGKPPIRSRTGRTPKTVEVDANPVSVNAVEMFGSPDEKANAYFAAQETIPHCPTCTCVGQEEVL